MARAKWKDVVLAESDVYEVVEGNVYFPPTAIRRQHFHPSATTTRCPWKGEAHYYTVTVDGETNLDAAWFYPDPEPAAAAIKDHVAFWRGVTVER
ncbi:MAG: DUF427 domain-containing protein [Gemmatimonadaceae bacterium]